MIGSFSDPFATDRILFGSDQSPPVVFGKKAGSMAFSLVSVVLCALAFWALLAGLERVLGDPVRSGFSAPAPPPLAGASRSASSRAVLAYATATSRVNGRAGTGH